MASIILVTWSRSRLELGQQYWFRVPPVSRFGDSHGSVRVKTGAIAQTAGRHALACVEHT